MPRTPSCTQGGRVGERPFQVDDGGQRVEIDRDVSERILGKVAALRQHHGQRLADVTDFVLGERHLGALIEGDVGDRRRRHEQRPRGPIIAEVLRGIDRDDTLARPRRGNVDRTDASVRDIAAQERRVQHAGKFDVVDEQCLAA